MQSQHKQLFYHSFQSTEKQDRELGIGQEVVFDFELDGGIFFKPQIFIPSREPLSEVLLFNLGLVELISYWKAACPKQVVIKAGALDQQQIEWWSKLYINGLSEFFYRHQLQPFAPNFTVSGESYQPSTRVLAERELVFSGGGKDSSLTLELLKRSQRPKSAAILGDIPSAKRAAKIAEYREVIEVRRIIDPQLLELNQRGYLNGHTPFSAYLAFLSVLLSEVCDAKYLIVSNERSADEENVEWRGSKINHQYSKTVEFEKDFRRYSKEYLNPNALYFSLLRPLHELQVSKLFVEHASKHLLSFRSCNVSQSSKTEKKDCWCRSCPKCLFVGLMLLPWVGLQKLNEILGAQMFSSEKDIETLRELSGLTPIKPFECVGTRREVIAALALSKQRMEDSLPQVLKQIISELLATELPARELLSLDAANDLLKDWGDDSLMEDRYQQLIRQLIH